MSSYIPCIASLFLFIFVLPRVYDENVFAYNRRREGVLSAIDTRIGNTVTLRLERVVKMGSWEDPSSAYVSPFSLPYIVGISVQRIVGFGWFVIDGWSSSAAASLLF